MKKNLSDLNQGEIRYESMKLFAKCLEQALRQAQIKWARPHERTFILRTNTAASDFENKHSYYEIELTPWDEEADISFSNFESSKLIDTIPIANIFEHRDNAVRVNYQNILPVLNMIKPTMMN